MAIIFQTYFQMPFSANENFPGSQIDNWAVLFEQTTSHTWAIDDPAALCYLRSGVDLSDYCLGLQHIYSARGG